MKYGILRQHLRNPELIKTLNLVDSAITNGLVVDLQQFSNIENVDRRAILENLGVDLSHMNDRMLSNKISSIMKRYVSLRKTNTEKGRQAMNKFLEENWLINTPSKPHERSAESFTATETALSKAQNQNSALIRQVEDHDQALALVGERADTLDASLKEKNNRLLEMGAELSASRANVQKLEAALLAAKDDVASLKATIKRIRGSNYYKRIQRAERCVKAKENIIREHEGGGCRRKVASLRRKVKLEQTKLSNTRANFTRKIAQLNQAHQDMLNDEEQQQGQRIIRLKDDQGHFLPAARVLIMALATECEVPAARCGTVIRTVVQHLLDGHVPNSDLPSQRSALRFSDQAHVISKIHVANVLVEEDHFDLHVDGTSRSGTKYICQSVNTPSGCFSLGYMPVAREDTSTLVEVSLKILEELSDLLPGQDAQDGFVTMLSGLSSLMTDRAAVMKSYGQALQEERRVLLQSDEGLNFLHCNAHFLLALAVEIKKVLLEDDKTRTEAPAGFLRAGECVAYRYIRIACDCLGPRGDDKNGCRDAWLAYCVTVAERQSAVTSFRENRFNNTFQGPAASLHFHREDVQDCLETYLPNRNQKVLTVLTDSKDETTDVHLIALGLVYFRITGPYWMLLGTKVHYLDFYKYVEDLVSTLRVWQDDPSPALSQDSPPVFTGIKFQEQPDVLQSLLNISQEKAHLVKDVLKKMAKAMMTATERQLIEFLPGGKYHNCEDEKLRQRLAHSLVTNLVAEESFADLDFSLFKRRNGTLHHHSTIAMMKKNRSISNWFIQRSSEDQQQLLSMSAKKTSFLRKQHQQSQAHTLAQRRQLMEEEKREREEKTQKRTQKVTDIVDTLKLHNGPCTSVEDLDRMLQQCTTMASLKTGLRAEVMFQKLVLQKKSPLLLASGKPLDVMNRLRQYFGAEVLTRLPLLQQPPAKRRRLALADVGELDEDDEDAAVDLATEDELEVEFETNFVFRQVGEVVGVYYVDGLFVGEVMSVENEENATVNFLESARGKGLMFRWPSRPDCCSISSSVVFAGNITLAPLSNSGRTFIVESPSDLPARYDAFKQHLIHNYAL